MEAAPTFKAIFLKRSGCHSGMLAGIYHNMEFMIKEGIYLTIREVLLDIIWLSPKSLHHG
jgi:hypothetical protein